MHRRGTGDCRFDQTIASSGIVCLTGVGHGGVVTAAACADIAAATVLKNNVIVGSVNANKRHWYKAGNLLARSDRTWLARLITRREKPENFMQALEREPDDIKVVIQFQVYRTRSVQGMGPSARGSQAPGVREGRGR
jgi:threonine dehydrogenase-like Zn-dependent dehydrogenase